MSGTLLFIEKTSDEGVWKTRQIAAAFPLATCHLLPLVEQKILHRRTVLLGWKSGSVLLQELLYRLGPMQRSAIVWQQG